VTLGQPDVKPERVVDRCLALASSELGCELRRHATGAATEKRQRGARR
jgi:hypothetical protein